LKWSTCITTHITVYKFLDDPAVKPSEGNIFPQI